MIPTFLYISTKNTFSNFGSLRENLHEEFFSKHKKLGTKISLLRS
jgi:hypothetical protein